MASRYRQTPWAQLDERFLVDARDAVTLFDQAQLGHDFAHEPENARAFGAGSMAKTRYRTRKRQCQGIDHTRGAERGLG